MDKRSDARDWLFAKRMKKECVGTGIFPIFDSKGSVYVR